MEANRPLETDSCNTQQLATSSPGRAPPEAFLASQLSGHSTPVDKDALHCETTTASFNSPIFFSSLLTSTLSGPASKKTGRPPSAFSLGRNRSLSDGNIKEYFLKRKRVEEEEQDALDPDLIRSPPVKPSDPKKLNRCLFPTVCKKSVSALPLPLAPATIDNNNTEMFSNSTSDVPLESFSPEYQALMKQLQLMQSQMSEHQVSLEQKITNFQVSNAAEFDKLRQEIQGESKNTASQLDLLREEMNKKYEDLAKQIKLKPASTSSAILNANQQKILDDMERRLELQERAIRRANIIIKGLPRQHNSSVADAQEFLKTYFNMENVVLEAREIGKGTYRKLWVHLISIPVREEIFSQKSKLRDTKIFIDPDLTKKEQEIYSKMITIGKEKRGLGLKVKIGFSSLVIDGKLFRWNSTSQSLVERARSSSRSSAPGALSEPRSTLQKNQ